MASATPGTEFSRAEQKSAKIGHNIEYDKGDFWRGLQFLGDQSQNLQELHTHIALLPAINGIKITRFLADLLVPHFSDSMEVSADSGISSKRAKSAPNGIENAGYRVSELLSMFTEAPKSSTTLKRKIGQINTDRDQLIDKASQDLVQILSHQFRGMDSAVIARTVEKVAETHRYKSHLENHSKEPRVEHYSLRYQGPISPSLGSGVFKMLDQDFEMSDLSKFVGLF